MKHIFILNPAAGSSKASKIFLPKIISSAKSMGIQYEIHRTVGVGDAEHFVHSRCLKERVADQNKESLRFYACGGDGTLNEVINGAYGFNNVEVTMIPAGTGNDFVRNFDEPKSFEDIERQINGKPIKLDLIHYKNDYTEKYCINMFNIGLDCNVVEEIAKMKKYFSSGSLAYILGVCKVFIKKENFHLQIEFEDGTKFENNFLLVAIGNGSYCGGGFKSNPYARLDDGKIDVIIINDISRLSFVSLIGKYKKGSHLEVPRIEKIITYKKCTSLEITPNQDMKLCIDGEISLAGKTKFTILPKSIRFSLPV